MVLIVCGLKLTIHSQTDLIFKTWSTVHVVIKFTLLHSKLCADLVLTSRAAYSETCVRQSPLGPDQLAIIQTWCAYRVHIKIS